MEKYYFCNFLGRLIKRDVKKGVVGVSVSALLDEEVQLADCYLINNGSGTKVMQFVSSSAGERCDGKLFDFIGSFNTTDKRLASSKDDLGHTEDNPIIVVATEEFTVFRGVPTYIKYMPVSGGVLVTLIKGYITVKDSEGNDVPLARNVSVGEPEVGKVFDAKTIREFNSLTDKESGVNYSDYVISDCIISMGTKDGKSLDSFKFSKDNFGYLCREVFEEAKVEKEERARIEAEEKERRREEFNRRLAEERAREEAEALLEAQKPKKTTKKKAVPQNAEIGAVGAASFLQFIQSVKESENGDK